MAKRILFTSLVFILLVACTSTPTGRTNSESATIPSSPMTPTNSSIPSPAVPSATPDSHVESLDLSAFASSWSTHDVTTIRSLYLDSARYFTEAEARKLYQEEPIHVLVSEDAFLDSVHKYDGYKMRILGKPFGVYGKLVAFAYRWERDDKIGYNGAALLRVEDGRIFLHIDFVSPQQIPGSADDTSHISTMSLDNLMKVWNDADLTAASQLYGDQAVILSDEDLAQALWRDFSQPAQIKDLFAQFAGWDPVVINEPIRIEDLVIFAWRWKMISYPAGYGIRLIHYDDSRIVSDIRFAIRPWEGNGKPFMNP